MVTRNSSKSAGAEQRLKEPGIKLPAPPEAVRQLCGSGADGQSAFLSGMLPTEGHGAKFVARVGAEIDVEAGRNAARLAVLNILAVDLGSLDK